MGHHALHAVQLLSDQPALPVRLAICRRGPAEGVADNRQGRLEAVRQILQGMPIARAPPMLVGNEAGQILAQPLEFLGIVVRQTLPPPFLERPDLFGHDAQRRQSPADGQDLRADHQKGHQRQPPSQAAAKAADDGLRRRLIGGHLEDELRLVRVIPNHQVGQHETRNPAGVGFREAELTEHRLDRSLVHVGGQRRRRTPLAPRAWLPNRGVEAGFRLRQARFGQLINAYAQGVRMRHAHQ